MNKNSTPPTQAKTFGQRKGSIVVLFALLLPVLIVIFGFCIDYANMHRVRNEGQVIADLCSKAAADTLARTGGDEALAIEAAQAVASSNSIGGVAHTLEPSEIIFGRAMEQADGRFTFTEGATPSNSVRVLANRSDAHSNGDVPLFFGNLYGRPGFRISQAATSSFRDVEVCLVLDRSVSMKWFVVGDTSSSQKRAVRCATPNSTSRWFALDQAIEVLLEEFDSTPVIERIGMVTFASETSDSCGRGIEISASTLDQPLTTSTAAIRNAMDHYNKSVWFGRTDITAGINEARRHMVAASSPLRERYIIVMTDGTHRGEAETPDQAAAACAAAGITVHTITFSDEADQTGMQLTAASGGGNHFHANESAELGEVFRRLAGTFAILTE